MMRLVIMTKLITVMRSVIVARLVTVIEVGTMTRLVIFEEIGHCFETRHSDGTSYLDEIGGLGTSEPPMSKWWRFKFEVSWICWGCSLWCWCFYLCFPVSERG